MTQQPPPQSPQFPQSPQPPEGAPEQTAALWYEQTQPQPPFSSFPPPDQQTPVDPQTPAERALRRAASTQRGAAQPESVDPPESVDLEEGMTRTVAAAASVRTRAPQSAPEHPRGVEGTVGTVGTVAAAAASSEPPWWLMVLLNPMSLKRCWVLTGNWLWAGPRRRSHRRRALRPRRLDRHGRSRWRPRWPGPGRCHRRCRGRGMRQRGRTVQRPYGP